METDLIFVKLVPLDIYQMLAPLSVGFAIWENTRIFPEYLASRVTLVILQIHQAHFVFLAKLGNFQSKVVRLPALYVLLDTSVFLGHLLVPNVPLVFILLLICQAHAHRVVLVSILPRMAHLLALYAILASTVYRVHRIVLIAQLEGFQQILS